MAGAPQNQAQRYRFGPFYLDAHSRELRKHGIKLKLGGHPIQILIHLLEHPGELVTRDQLRERLWPADTFVDFDHGLNSAIKRLARHCSTMPTGLAISRPSLVSDTVLSAR